MKTTLLLPAGLACLLFAPHPLAAAKSPSSPPPVPEVYAEQAALGPGRYRFTTLAGAPGIRGHADGTGSAARFDHPGGVAVDAAGNAYVSETDLCTVRKITPDGVVTTLAGTAGEKGSQDGAGAAARFNHPLGLAVDSAGNVYVADNGNHLIRKIDPAGNVTTIAGRVGEGFSINGNRATARLAWPTFLAVDDAGNVYFSEITPGAGRTIYYPSEIPLKSYPERAIRKVAPDGTVSQLVIGIVSAPGNRRYYVPGWPYALGADHAGNLYAIYSDDWDFSDAVRLTRTANGEYEGQPLLPPTGGSWATCLAVDEAGDLYIKYYADPVCRYTPDGGFETRPGAGSSGGFPWTALAVDPLGRLVVLPQPDSYAEKTGTIEAATFDPAATGLAFLLQPADREGAVRGTTVQFDVLVAGTPPYTYQWYLNTKALTGAAGSSLILSRVQDGDAGYYSVLVTDATGSATSRVASLTVVDPPPPPPPPQPPQPTPPYVPVGATAAGGGAPSGGFLAALATLLVAREIRRPRPGLAQSVRAGESGIEPTPAP